MSKWRPGESRGGGKKKTKWWWDDWKDNPFNKITELELVNPKLSYWDKRDLYSLILKDLRKFVTTAQILPYKDMGETQFEVAVEKIFPKYMLYDTYNINYTPTKAIEFGDTDEKNEWLFKFLMDKATGYYTKTVTQNSTFNSFVYSSEIIKQLLLLYQQQNPNGPDQNEGQSGNGKGQSGMEKMLKKMLGSGQGNEKLDQSMQEAQRKADERIGDKNTEGSQLGELGSDKSLGDFSLGELSEFLDYTEALENIVLSETMVSSFVKTTLKLSQAYFSKKYSEHQVEVMEADVIDDIQGIENLIPALRAVNLDDIITHERTYHMKFDVYIDISGSMSSSMLHYSYESKKSLGGTRNQLSGLDLAKVTAIKLKNMGFVDDVYPFESRVHHPLKDKSAIALMRCTGGTNINEVIKSVQKTGKPSVVITDMEDSIGIYDSNVYFIGILGAQFDNFKQSTVGKNYVTNQQCVKYNHTTQNFDLVH